MWFMHLLAGMSLLCIAARLPLCLAITGCSAYLRGDRSVLHCQIHDLPSVLACCTGYGYLALGGSGLETEVVKPFTVVPASRAPTGLLASDWASWNAGPVWKCAPLKVSNILFVEDFGDGLC